MIGYIVLGAVVLFVAVLLVRAALFHPVEETLPPKAEADVDADRAIASLQAMVRIPTISNWDIQKMDEAVFEEFRQLLVQLYPNVHAACSVERVGATGVLYHWKGKRNDAPTVLMSHYDVVPAKEEDGWQKPPFAGVIENDVLWGRGTIDTKSTLCGVMESVETLIGQGFVPEHDIYLSFAGDEEVAGPSAPAAVEWLRARCIRPALVVDEGGAVVDKVFPGVTAPCALIGVGEKGMANIELSAESGGGHASTPPRHTPLGILARGIIRVEKRPFKAAMPAPTVEMMQTLGRYSSFGLKIVLANLWCFKGLLARAFAGAGGEMGAMCHTTIAFTQAQGSPAPNVLPHRVSAVANLRLARDTTAEQALAHLSKAAGKGVKAELLFGNNASPYADTKSEVYRRVKLAAQHTYEGAIVSPYIMMACSDSRHFCAICDNVLRFSPLELSKADRSTIHAVDERLSKQKLARCVEFYIRLIRQC